MNCVRALACAALLMLSDAASAGATVVKHGYLPLKDGTKLNYTLTLPKADGRFPVVMQYDPYYAGATSDPTWNDSGYAMLGVNFRGTGCSEGVFHPTRADLWGVDGAQVVDWAAKQQWSDGNLAMLGYSFTGTSQIATAAYAGPALKAIMPGNVFPDMYRDLVYPGGIYNSWIAVWVAARNYALGAPAVGQVFSDPSCAVGLVQQVVPNELQTLDTALHPYIDDAYWTREPATLAGRVHIPILGCVNWQDTTVQSRGFNELRDDFNPKTTWVVGGDGAHGDCPISRARRVRFLDRYVKHQRNDWEKTPHLVVVHEVPVARSPGRDQVPDDAGKWQSSFATWADVASAIKPVPLYLRGGGRLDLAKPAAPEPADSYAYGAPTANTPADFGGASRWKYLATPGGSEAYTTPPLGRDAEFLGSGSANLWLSSTATDSDVQITLSEIRPDGREEFVENGWLRLSHRKLDAKRSNALLPLHTDAKSDSEPLTPGTTTLARIELEPFDHVFRKGSAVRLTIDTPAGGWLLALPGPATMGVHHSPGMESALVLGHVAGARAHAAPPSCSALLNQPCRKTTGTVPGGSLVVPEPVTLKLGAPMRSGKGLRVSVRADGGRVRNVRVVLRDKAGRRVGQSQAFTLGTRARRVFVRLTRRLRPGRYTLRAAGAGHVTTMRRYVVT